MTDPAIQRFARNVRETRLQAGLSQEALARRAGLHYGHVARIERGEREPGVRTIAKLAHGLDVPVAVLFEGVEAGERPGAPGYARSASCSEQDGR